MRRTLPLALSALVAACAPSLPARDVHLANQTSDSLWDYVAEVEERVYYVDSDEAASVTCAEERDLAVALEAGIGHWPGDTGLRYSRATSLVRQHRYDEAEQAFVELRGIDRDDWSIPLALGFVKHFQGDDAAALAYLASADDEGWEVPPTDTENKVVGALWLGLGIPTAGLALLPLALVDEAVLDQTREVRVPPTPPELRACQGS